MTTEIARRGLPAGPDAEHFAEQLASDLTDEINDLEDSSELIDFAFSSGVMNLRAHCVNDPQAEAVETWEAAVNAMQLGSALFAVTAKSEGTVECRINGKVRTLQATGPLPTAAREPG